jgi:type IV pilus assembly protein PilM
VARERVLLKAIQELMAQKPYGSRNINACAPGFHVFSKFVKLPPVDASKVGQIIQYEAKQNVPFPLEEVVWDFQILGANPSGELEVLLVAIKSDVVEGVFRTAESSGMRVQLVDVSPAALCNAFRYNYGDLEGCTMLLDIGAKTSNVLFFDKDKFFARGINIGANAITQELAAEARIRFAEAEESKIADGFVSLGGAYEEPDNPRQAQISKIARQVMTRLHIQVNQTIQFYRGQQGGGKPQRVFLAGGASVMAYTAQFFAEKLDLEVEYLNPFKNVEIDPSLDLEELAGVAHSFGEVVGLGLRSVAQCPVELNLMPKSALKRQQFNQKKPYFITTVISLLLVVLAFGWSYAKLAQIKTASLAEIKIKVDPLKELERRLKRELSRRDGVNRQLQQYQEWSKQRFYWSDVFEELRHVLIQTEMTRKQQMSGVDNGVWIETLKSPLPGAGTGDATSSAAAAAASGDAEQTRSIYYQKMLERYGIQAVGGVTGSSSATTAVTPETPSRPRSTNEVTDITLTLRAVNLKRLDPTANDQLAYAFERHLRESPLFDAEETKLTGNIQSVDDSELTFTFGVSAVFAEPLKM